MSFSSYLISFFDYKNIMYFSNKLTAKICPFKKKLKHLFDGFTILIKQIIPLHINLPQMVGLCFLPTIPPPLFLPSFAK